MRWRILPDDLFFGFITGVFCMAVDALGVNMQSAKRTLTPIPALADALPILKTNFV
jgi:hypothetical protein